MAKKEMELQTMFRPMPCGHGSTWEAMGATNSIPYVWCMQCLLYILFTCSRPKDCGFGSKQSDYPENKGFLEKPVPLCLAKVGGLTVGIVNIFFPAFNPYKNPAGWWFGIFGFPYVGNNHSSGLPYVSEGLKPPTTQSCKYIENPHGWQWGKLNANNLQGLVILGFTICRQPNIAGKSHIQLDDFQSTCAYYISVSLLSLLDVPHISGWWFGTWILWLSIQLGMPSSQLTNSLHHFSEG